MESQSGIPQPTAADITKADIAKADITKLHSEINQYIDQIWSTVSTSTTIFGVVIGWIVFGLSREDGSIDVNLLIFILPSALLILLMAMLCYVNLSFRQIHVISTYMCLTEQSIWEEQYQKFRNSYKRLDQESVIFIILLILSILTFIVPFVLLLIFKAQSGTTLGSAITILVILEIIYIIEWIFFWSRRDPKDFRKEVAGKWCAILGIQEVPESFK